MQLRITSIPRSNCSASRFSQKRFYGVRITVANGNGQLTYVWLNIPYTTLQHNVFRRFCFLSFLEQLVDSFHRLPPNRCHRFRHPRAQTTPHHSIIHTPKMIVYLAPNKFQFSKGSPPPTLHSSQIRSSTRTNNSAQFDRPPTANTSPPSSTRQNSKFQFSRGSPPPTHRLRTPTTPTITHIHTTPRKPSPTPSSFGGTCER